MTEFNFLDGNAGNELLDADTLAVTELIKDREIPRFITIEGPIGVGKTTLAKRLAESFNYETLLERAEENPFLAGFYKNRRQNALATQLFFLFQRAQQIQDMRQQDLFSPVRIADFLIEKDRLFARANLEDNEFALYEQVYSQITIDAPKPDLVIYLQAPVDALMDRILKRGISEERNIDRDYLELLNEAYSEFFLYYDDAPLLIVNCADIDFINNDDHYLTLIDYMLNVRGGRHYFNPTIFS
ncbi:MAG TPA: deoxynucleoside kinase [Cellvibrionales bacterium]|jgi:deoxyadenosine/deoxycytidine kinase|nr:deoxynucleoside kinase [Cellvibrionales bacterium]HAW14521.1 deoxynucleoside kinase [Cellvibrionales bacterium]HCX26693.1 deoxynucleoside kinase [Cellvibrionales bacterium]